MSVVSMPDENMPDENMPDENMPDENMIVEVVPDVTGLDRSFDYLVPERLRAVVAVGSKVRVNLNGRRVAGWVVAVRHEETVRQDLKEILVWSSVGPDEDVVDLCRWAARRWCVSKLRPFLVASSPNSNVDRPAPAHRTRIEVGPVSPAAQSLLASGGGVLRLPPTVDQMPAVLSAVRRGPTIVVCPTVDASKVLAARLRRTGLSVALMPQDWAVARGGVDVTVGARSAAFAPCPELAAAVLLDEHDESLREERMPTWHARDVLAERCRRHGVPLLVVSPSPTAVGSFGRTVVAPPPERERAGWPEVRPVDRSGEPPWERSLLTSEVIEVARNTQLRVICIANTKGLARLLACRRCSSLLRCEDCESTLVEIETGRLDCSVCGTSRPRVCSVCSATTLARLKPGVTRLRDELERAANRPVAAIESSRSAEDENEYDVFVGTSATLHRVRRADVVAFLDFDRELLAPRFQAHEQAMALLIAAARIVGPRDRQGRILVQTTLADHDVVRAAVAGDASMFTEPEMRRRRALGLPPFSALAAIEGDGVDQCVEFATSRSDVSIGRHRGGALIRAVDHDALSDFWESIPPAIRSAVRIDVDPLSA